MTVSLALAETPAAPLATGGSRSLPALIDRARTRLAEARTSAEVLEARAAAKAALHYAKLLEAANVRRPTASPSSSAPSCAWSTRSTRRSSAARSRAPTPMGEAYPSLRDPDTGRHLSGIGFQRQRVAEWRDLAMPASPSSTTPSKPP